MSPSLYCSHVSICVGSVCGSGSNRLKAKLIEELTKHGLHTEIEVDDTECLALCDQGPLMIVYPEGVLYCHLTEDDVVEIVEKHFLKGRIVDRLRLHEPITDEVIPSYKDLDFYKKQERVVLANCGKIDPESIYEYIAAGGYEAAAKALVEMTPEAVIDEVKNSGLRGRGGAGFPTGIKWELTRKAESDKKYLVCNADEGDPGAFMDRSLLEGDPHRIIEGMIIAAYAVGADEGYVYIRAEYPLAIKRLKTAIDQAVKLELLGEDIFSSGFNFTLDIKKGAGAFVCGEETALIASIEGKRGMPRPKPPFPSVSGLWNKPTNINNVETFGNIPFIIKQGSGHFNSIGTEKSKGTKIFALTGKINNTGLVEVPMGITLRDIIYDIGGGIIHGKKFKAVQTGGPSGGCIPTDLLDIAIDYESLNEVGAMMGSGGMVVMDDSTCMVDVARFFLSFTQSESCGKCTPCREGTKRMLEILDRICSGEGRNGDIELLEELGNHIKDTSLCQLGGSAPNPVLSTIKYFRDEYEAHIERKSCPANVCKGMGAAYVINQDKCIGCGMCAKMCPTEAINGNLKESYQINVELCVSCGACVAKCPVKAIIQG